MSRIKQDMPILARNEGVWDGFYRVFDIDGNKLDEHRSRLICRFDVDDETPYYQTNLYRWDDGRTERRDFKPAYRDKRLWFDDALIKGWAAEVDLDEAGRTIMLHWVRQGEPDIMLYEMIQNSDCGRYRTRVWQWLKGGRTLQRTLIDEVFVTPEWHDVEDFGD